jgi:cysteine desulfurase
MASVLQAMGVTPEVGMGAIRFSLGRGTTREEIDVVAEGLSGLPGAAFMAMSVGKTV